MKSNKNCLDSRQPRWSLQLRLVEPGAPDPDLVARARALLALRLAQVHWSKLGLVSDLLADLGA